MIPHLNRKAIADTLLKILIIEVCEVVPDMLQEHENSIKYELLEKLFDAFALSDDEEKRQNISEMLSEAINNKKFCVLLLKNKSLFQKIYGFISSNIKKDYIKYLLRVNNRLCDVILRELKSNLNKENDTNNGEDNLGRCGDYDDPVPNKPGEMIEMSECPHILEILGNELEELIAEYVGVETSLMQTTFDKTVRILGMKKLFLFEYIKNMLEIFSLSLEGNGSTFFSNKVKKKLKLFLEVLIENKFFSKSIDNFFNYEWNNSYLKGFEGLVEIILSLLPQLSENVLLHIFSAEKFMDRMIDSFATRFYFNSGKNVNPGYLPFVVQISFNIKNSKSKVLKAAVSKSMCLYYIYIYKIYFTTTIIF